MSLVELHKFCLHLLLCVAYYCTIKQLAEGYENSELVCYKKVMMPWEKGMENVYKMFSVRRCNPL